MKNTEKWLITHGFKSQVANLVNNQSGLFVEIFEIPRQQKESLMKYLKRTKAVFEYRAGYTAILIKGGEK